MLLSSPWHRNSRCLPHVRWHMHVTTNNRPAAAQHYPFANSNHNCAPYISDKRTTGGACLIVMWESSHTINGIAATANNRRGRDEVYLATVLFHISRSHSHSQSQSQSTGPAPYTSSKWQHLPLLLVIAVYGCFYTSMHVATSACIQQQNQSLRQLG